MIVTNVRKPRTALFSLSSARRVLPHAENRFRMWRLVFRVRRNVSACGDSCRVPSPHAEIRVPRAEDPLRMQRLVFRVRKTVSACGRPSPHAEISVPRAENLASYVYYTPRRLHFNLVRLGKGGRSQVTRKSRQINLDLFKI